MMNKLVLSDSWDFDRNSMQVVKVSSHGPERGQFTKSAALFDDKIASIRHEPGTAVIHAIAMGASERYGPNKNADAFSRAMLKSAHPTFVSHGHVFKEHINDDPKKASGSILHSAYNDIMDRVELMLRVKEAAWQDELTKIANDEDIAFSMSCRVPYDVCSFCGNKAPTRASYCDHMRKYAGQMLDDGHLVHCDNPKGIFFDMSGVRRQADRIAYGLRQIKAASLDRVITGSELFDLWSAQDVNLIRSKSATSKEEWLRKLAVMEKEIPAKADKRMPYVFTSGNNGRAIAKLRTYMDGSAKKSSEVFRALADAGVSLPVHEFAQLCCPEEMQTKSAVADAMRLLPGVFSLMLTDKAASEAICSASRYDAPKCNVPEYVSSVVRSLVPDLSLEHKSAKARIVRRMARGDVVSPPSIKLASSSAEGFGLAREYAIYKLAFVDSAGGDGESSLARLSVMQNFA